LLQANKTAYVIALAAEDAARRSLHRVVDELVADYFQHFGAPTKKAEHAEMVRLRITSISYQQYLALRRNGRPVTAACGGLQNIEWLRLLAAARSLAGELDELLSHHQATQEATRNASDAIVRRQIA
jgi:hypothetical protein